MLRINIINVTYYLFLTENYFKFADEMRQYIHNLFLLSGNLDILEYSQYTYMFGSKLGKMQLFDTHLLFSCDIQSNLRVEIFAFAIFNIPTRGQYLRYS